MSLKERLEQIPTLYKSLSLMAAGIVATAAYLQTYQTDAEAAEKWAQHDQAIACRTVTQLKAEIRAKEAQIQFDKTLSPADKKWLQEQIQQIKTDIRRYDPKGQC